MITYEELKELAATAINRKYSQPRDIVHKIPIIELDKALRLIEELKGSMKGNQIANPTSVQQETLARIKTLLATR